MGNTTTLGNKSKFRELLDSFGLPRLIIACFLLLLLIAAPIVGLDFPTQITNIITRFSWNAVMVLAMVPMVHSGCGLNFGLPLGIISGLLGATLSIEFGFTGGMSFLMAIVIATPFALVFGGGYGWLLNKIKGGEMMIATYVGFSSVSFMCMMWLLLPYKHPTMVWGFSASGLRTVISLEGYYDKALANILTIDLNSIGINLVIPTGTLLFNAVLYAMCLVLFSAPTAIYSAIYTVFNALFVDRVHQQNITTQVLVVTKLRDLEPFWELGRKMDRGITYWSGHGAYTGDEVQILCICLSKYEIETLQQEVRKVDPHAFFMVQEGVHTLGNFKRHLNP